MHIYKIKTQWLKRNKYLFALNYSVSFGLSQVVFLIISGVTYVSAVIRWFQHGWIVQMTSHMFRDQLGPSAGSLLPGFSSRIAQVFVTLQCSKRARTETASALEAKHQKLHSVTSATFCQWIQVKGTPHIPGMEMGTAKNLQPYLAHHSHFQKQC